MNKLFVAVCCLSLVCQTEQVEARVIRASEDPVRDEPEVTKQDRGHWAFQPLSAVDGGIDALIDEKLKQQGLKRSVSADPATLLRRLSFDLTGLPPTKEERSVFEREWAMDSQAAVEGLVDRLLASPGYGEHWAQWWLDLARFAETDGFEHDKERARAWRYRDWVIQSFNRDLPFDEFVRQQVAGDLLADGEAVATGFLFAGPDMPDLNRQEERRHVVLNEITSTVGSVFLGMTLGCAQCHDHVYDPLSQADFYRMRAFFDNTVVTKRDRPLGPEVRVFGEGVPPSVVFVRGQFDRPGPLVKPGFLRVLGDFGVRPTDRVALADWLTQADNVLVLRTVVNRIWQQHLGRPLAPVPGDLGRQSAEPMHRELLDWLAGELPRQGWSLKRLHKVIVMSATYRQATAGPDLDEEAVAWYAAMPRRRLTGEALRDTLLAVAGRLNRKSGGEGVRLSLPAEVAGTLLKKQAEASPASQEEQRRRSIYAFVRRNARVPIFDLFDRPDALASCARRDESTTAPQALLLLNAELSQQTADDLAAAAMTQAGDDEGAVVRWLVQRCFGREAQAEEEAIGRAFLTAAESADKRNRTAELALALINANEFVFVD